MPTYRLELEYDGGAFHGWQVQPEQRTVQGVLTAALAQICGGAPPRVEGAGRTDAGVHALGQVASFSIDAGLEPRRLLHALGGLLPADVRVFSVGRADADFSARHTATARVYRYQWLRTPSALLGRFHAELPIPVDVERMQAAATVLLGEHDFSAFAAAGSGGRCRVIAARVVDQGARLAFEIEADRFLHNMVRRLAGALLDVGRGRETQAGLAAALAAPAPRGPCLPARGLFLVAVRYPHDAEYEATAVAAAPPTAPWESV